MNIGVSPITHTIYASKSKPLKNGKGRVWVGRKEDVTDEAIGAVFTHMFYKSEETGYYEFKLDGYGTMSFSREKEASGG